MALPWIGLSKQSEQDGEQGVRQSLEDKKITHGSGKISLKGSTLASWDFYLKLDNVGSNLDLSAPPGFRAASLNGFTMEAPLGKSWNFAVQGQVEGRAAVKVGGQKVLSWSPSLFPFGLRVSNFRLTTNVQLDASRPDQPRVISAVIQPQLSVGGEGFIPVSIPVSFQAQFSGGKLHLIGKLTNLSMGLGPLDGRLTGDLVITLEPQRYDVGAEVDLQGQVFGVTQGDEINVSAAFHKVTVALQGKLQVTFKFSYLGSSYTKPVEVPFSLSFPFVIPTTDELTAAIRGLQPGLPLVWPLSQPVITTDPPPATLDLVTVAAEIETGILPHLPFGTVHSLDFPPQKLTLSEPQRPYSYGVEADSATWTAHYLAAESFRYAAMPSQAAIERVKLALGGIKRLFDVTADAVGPPSVVQVQIPFPGGPRIASYIPVTAGPGIFSRTVRRSDHPIDYSVEPGGHKGPLETRPCYYLHPEGGWRVDGDPSNYPTFGSIKAGVRMTTPQLIHPVGPIWYGWGCGTDHPLSRDAIVSVFMGLAMAYHNVADQEVRTISGTLIEQMLDHLLRNNWNVVLPPDNRFVPTSTLMGDFSKQLAFLRIGKSVNGPKYGPVYDRYKAASELTWLTVLVSSLDPIFQYYKFNLTHAAFAPLLFLETDPSLRANYMVGYNMLWRTISHHKNAYFDLLHILVQLPAERAAMAMSRAPSNVNLSLADEIKSLLGEWIARRNFVKGPNGLPRNDIANWEYQRDLWPNQVGRFTTLDGHTGWLATRALPIWGRTGRGMDFLWQRHPFNVGLNDNRKSGSPPPDLNEILANGATGINRLREGPGVDYLLAYYLGVYLGLLPK